MVRLASKKIGGTEGAVSPDETRGSSASNEAENREGRNATDLTRGNRVYNSTDQTGKRLGDAEKVSSTQKKLN